MMKAYIIITLVMNLAGIMYNVSCLHVPLLNEAPTETELKQSIIKGLLVITGGVIALYFD